MFLVTSVIHNLDLYTVSNPYALTFQPNKRAYGTVLHFVAMYASWYFCIIHLSMVNFWFVNTRIKIRCLLKILFWEISTLRSALCRLSLLFVCHLHYNNHNGGAKLDSVLLWVVILDVVPEHQQPHLRDIT